MHDETASWLKPIAVGTISATLGPLSTHWLTAYPVLWIAVVFFIVCTTSALVGGWMIGKAKTKRLSIYCELLTRLNQMQQAAIEDKVEESMERYIGDFFDAVCEQPTLEHVHAAAIFLLDDKDPDWLVAWGFSSKKGKSAKRFFVGKQTGDREDRAAPGVAGTVFIEGKPQIVNLDRKGRADHPMYHRFREKSTSAYRSFVVSPIRWNGKPVGVLSLESNTRKVFTDDEKPWYQAFADSVGNALYHFGRVRTVSSA